MNHSYHHSSIAGQVLLLLCCATILLSACSGIETAQVVPSAGPGTVYPPTPTPKPHSQENNRDRKSVV
jgi:hypothetical protein